MITRCATNYENVVPGHSYSNTSGNANCSANAYGNSAIGNCSGTSYANTTITAPHLVSFSVTGSTLTLLLPDGRTVVVNCARKFAERMAGREGNHRSCRESLVENIQAEFKGKNAKLFWVVSLDGKKVESETYKIIAVMEK